MGGKRWFELVGVMAVGLVSIGCGEELTSSGVAATDEADGVQVVVTTNLLGDVVQELVGDLAEVSVIMPVGSDPHSFQASARQVDDMIGADALIINGAGFEANLLGPIEAAMTDGVPTLAAISTVPALEAGDDHDDHDEPADEDEHGGEHREQEEGHSQDPHFFTDPARMAVAAVGITEFLIEAIPELDTDEFVDNAASYVAELEDLDAEVARTLDSVPPEDRVLITNHEVFAYFADRYDFEVIGTVIPSGSTGGAASASELVSLADLVEAEGVPAVFADTSSPTELAATLAAEVDSEIQVVELFTESLGEPGSEGGTYLGMIRTNAERVADALT